MLLQRLSDYELVLVARKALENMLHNHQIRSNKTDSVFSFDYHINPFWANVLLEEFFTRTSSMKTKTNA